MADHVKVSVERPTQECQIRTYCDIAGRALFFPDINNEAWIKREGIENVRIARLDGRVVGGLVAQPMGQWFGGRSIPMSGIRGVAVATEHRACGIASELMRSTLCELREAGVPLSALYPATQTVYRRAGYERAGARIQYRVRTRDIDIHDRTLTLREIEQTDHPAIKEVYARWAQSAAGNLDRNDWAWDRVLDPPPWRSRMYGYVVERGGEIEGYAVLSQKIGNDELLDHELQVVDFVMLTREAGRRLMTCFADHRSVAEAVTWYGAPVDPALCLLAEEVGRIVFRMDWMLRLVDVARALAARGYPPNVSGEVHLDVVDDFLPQNHGRLILTVNDGRAEVHEGGSGAVRIDVRGLASLYSGHLAPAVLKTSGYADGSDRDLACLATIFAGQPPWMSDVF